MNTPTPGPAEPRSTTSASDKLIVRAFCMETKDGRIVVAGYAVDTDQGTPALWRYLEQCGYVEKNTRTGRGRLGHRFSRKLTDQGREYLAQFTTPKEAAQ